MLFQGLGKVFYNFVVIFVLAFTVTVIMFYKFFGFISIGRILIYFLNYKNIFYNLFLLNL